MNKDVLFITHFVDDFDKLGNGRFNYIIDKLAEESLDIELVTSTFSHNKKKKREKINKEYSYKVTLISEPGYKANVSIERFYSHFIMGINLKKYLYSRKKPDVIYCSVPSLDIAFVTAKYAKLFNIKLIIDIQDLWPEAFKMIFSVPMISDIFFYPMKKKANYIYKMADEIVAVSQTYLNRALEINNKSQNSKNVYLGTNLEYFDVDHSSTYKNKKKEIRLVYIGTLGQSYDIKLVIDSLYILKNNGIKNVKFILMGDGPLATHFEQYAASLNVSCEFKGRLSYAKMVDILSTCDIAINPIKAKSAGSIINKVGDYAAAGLPVINTQESEEYRQLIDDYNAGFNCITGNNEDVSSKLLELINNKELREKMGANNRRLAEERFDRGKTYKEIIDLILNI